MDDWRDDRHYSGRPSRRNSSRSPESYARPRRDRGGGGRGARGGGQNVDRSTSRSRSALARRSGAGRDMRRARSWSRRRPAGRDGDERSERRDKMAPETRDTGRSRSPSSENERPRKKLRSGFDQKEMLPENYAMQQLTNVKLQELTAFLPQAKPQPKAFNPRRIWDTLPTEITHINPEVETFLQQNEVSEHAQNRLRALPIEVQTLILERGSIRKSRDPTAVLMTRIRNAVTNPSQLWAPALGGLGAIPSLNPPAKPALPEGATASTQPAGSSSFSGVVSPGGEGSSVGNSNSGTGSNPAALQDGDARDWSSWKPEPQALENSAWGSSGKGDDSKSWDESDSWDKPWTKWLYGSDKQQSYADSQREPQRQGEPDLAAETSKSGAPKVVAPALRDLDDAKAETESNTEKAESEAERKKREEMQSSIAATIASLSAKVLPKDKVTKFLGNDEAKESGTTKSKSGDDDSDEDMDIDDEVGAAASTMPKAQLKLPISVPSNPFRSKPHAAPVSQQTDPEPTEPGLSMPLPALIGSADRHTESVETESEPPKIPRGLQALAQMQKGSADSEGRMEAAKIPLGLRALRMQKGFAAAGSRHPTMMPGDEAKAITSSPTSSETPQQLPLPGASVVESAPVVEPAADGKSLAASAKAAPTNETPEEKKKRVQMTAKRAYALATLINYGLVDPDDEADLTKSVHAMAAATGDHAAAMSMWQHVTGKEPAQQVESTPPVVENPEPVIDFQNLSEQQQAEMQQAAAAAQYSQLWMQQQFQAQMQLQETERLMKSGDLPNGSADGEFLKVGGAKGKGKSASGKGNNWAVMLPGDWTCPGCGDHQFSRNKQCRFCHTPKPHM